MLNVIEWISDSNDFLGEELLQTKRLSGRNSWVGFILNIDMGTAFYLRYRSVRVVVFLERTHFTGRR
jgi:hypothetical protein